ncbi:hairy and enhancer of split related-7 [Dunckerocampus dactyliophorus]|uniref:hairy and enhancer of split related-7 n=1 Tax=Dunckerocampus dactyliophorus TaxID=161453 RepID=UPI002406AFD5|nr:hairy and enhancer of split related-7 [Dunckerocampus dactyliophorus]
MKTMPETDEASNDRKLIKSQAEKRRRERMNHSLERLRIMLMHQPQQQDVSQRRVEKTEILENTVLFLHNTATKAKTTPSGPSYQDGFSACLQRAAHFLGPEAKGLWLVAARDAHSFAARSVEHPSSAASSSSILHVLRQKSKHRLLRRASGVSPSVQPPRTLSQPQGPNWLETCVESHSASPAPSQTLWRPWP